MAVVGEIKRLFHSGVPTTDDDDLLAAIEKSVASGASRNALALKQHLAFQTQPLGLGARRDDQRVGIILHATVTRSEEHTSELQSLMRISYAVFGLKKKKNKQHLYS